MSALDLFRCEPYACRLTRAACAQRYESAQHAGRPSPVAVPPSLRWSLCRSCEVGAAHARGERPDVDAAALVRREEVGVATTYTHGGKTLTAGQWAQTPEVAALGLSAQAIRSRIEIGWTVGDALTTPKGSPRPTTSEPKKSTKPRDEAPRKRPVQRAPRKSPTAEQQAVKAGYEAGKAVARVRATLASKKSTKLRTFGSAEDLVGVLGRLGYVVEDAGLVPAGLVPAGLVPAGRLLIVRVPA